MLAFQGSWMEFRDEIYSDDDRSGSADTYVRGDGGTDSGYDTFADAVPTRCTSRPTTRAPRPRMRGTTSRRMSSLTVTPRICAQRADEWDGSGATGPERLCMPSGCVGNERRGVLEPSVWDRQVNSYNPTTTYGGEEADLAWFEALRP